MCADIRWVSTRMRISIWIRNYDNVPRKYSILHAGCANPRETIPLLLGDAPNDPSNGTYWMILKTIVITADVHPCKFPSSLEIPDGGSRSHCASLVDLAHGASSRHSTRKLVYILNYRNRDVYRGVQKERLKNRAEA